MPGTGVLDRAVPRVEADQQQSHVLSPVEILDKGVIDAAEDSTRVGLQHRKGTHIRPGFSHHQSGAESVTTDVADGETETSVRLHNEVEIVPPVSIAEQTVPAISKPGDDATVVLRRC